MQIPHPRKIIVIHAPALLFPASNKVSFAAAKKKHFYIANFFRTSTAFTGRMPPPPLPQSRRDAVLVQCTYYLYKDHQMTCYVDDLLHLMNTYPN